MQVISLDEGLPIFSPEHSAELMAIDEALTRLAAVSPRQSRVVELRFFGGLTVEEIAEALGVAPKTVKRDWNVARAWLYREINGPGHAKEVSTD